MRASRSLLPVLCIVLAMPLGAQQTGSGPHGALPEDLDCSACHTSAGWAPLRTPLGFDHDARTGFTLSGAHEDVGCVGCHEDLRFDGPEASMGDCASCHRDVHEGRMVRDCADCHQTSSFLDVDGDLLHARTSFPLTGAHGQLTCESCHLDDTGGSFSPLEADCVSCHAADYQSAATVDHVSNGYPTDCTECHSAVGWSDAPEFDHGLIGWGFDLVGAHSRLRCASCHQVPGMEPLFQPTGQNDCVACHLSDYQEEHGGSTFPTTCLSCHGVDDWDVSDFDHDFAGFPLVERHAQLDCGECHTDGSGDLKFPTPSGPEDCVACHQADYDDEHEGSGFSTTCLECHTQRNWEASSFNHTLTEFPLLGAHTSVDCVSCHGPPTHLANLVATAEDCLACHQTQFDETHTGSGYPPTCLACHDQTNWEEATFDHSTTSFPLEGPHAEPACAACHTPPTATATLVSSPEDCVVCHQVEYDQSHAGSNISTQCSQCHSGNTWEDAEFDHAQTSFALEGVHATATCETCHSVPDYGLLFPTPSGPQDCVACHQGEYDTNHAGSSFPTTCTDCHTGDTWLDATADHVALSGGFALEGVHQTATCETCHSVPDYGLLFPTPSGPQDCVACHQGEYDTNHAGSSFPTTCTDCHTVQAWTPSTFDHDAQYFPIYSGKHAQEWNDCSDCHNNPGNIAQIHCLSCHEHRKEKMDDTHSGEPDYTYTTAACLTCHPRGES